MNPIVLGGLIVGGLLLIDVLLRLYGQRGGGQLASGKDAIEQFRREYPEVAPTDIGRVVLTPDGRNAFLAMASGATGFVRGMGDRFVTRQLKPGDIAALERVGERGLTLRFHDVTLRRISLEFATVGDRDFVVDTLSAG